MRKIQGDVYEYTFDEFVLTLYSNTNVVEVRVTGEKPHYLDMMSALPDWVFSPEALWVRHGNGPVDRRLQDGEAVKQYLLMNPPVYVRPRVADDKRTTQRRRVMDRRQYDRRRPADTAETRI